MRRAAATVLAAAMLASCGGAPMREPAKPVELERYLGRWYEIARYPNRFERGCEAVTADYAKRVDGGISVTNTCRKGSPDGPVDQAVGRAKVVGGDGAKLKVSFFGPFYGDYWVLDRADDYSWALVGGGSDLFWILARRPDPPNRAELVRRAEALGYDSARFVYPRHAPTAR